ncbi:MAG: hypothetical protein PV337_06255 [Rickettsiaceae bacterium]|nr:hypothetical protein [Rickettsiaceae bacterium]
MPSLRGVTLGDAAIQKLQQHAVYLDRHATSWLAMYNCRKLEEEEALKVIMAV